MDAEERAIREEIARYRGIRSLNLMKAVICLALGGLLLWMVASGDLIPNGELPASATLGRALGKTGTTAVAIGIGVLFILIGIIWALRLIRDLRDGVKQYEAQLRSGVAHD